MIKIIVQYNGVLADRQFKYELTREEFNKTMQIKKTAERYDKFGRKKVKVSKNMSSQAIAKFGTKLPERIKPDYIKEPFALVLMSTTPDLADATESDHYLLQGYLVTEEGETARVYRDSLNDGYTNAVFCDDTVMLIMVVDKDKNKRYFQIEGEPTCYASWKFDQEKEESRKFFHDAIAKQHDLACKKFNLPKERVFVVIQLEDV